VKELSLAMFIVTMFMINGYFRNSEYQDLVDRIEISKDSIATKLDTLASRQLRISKVVIRDYEGDK